MKFLKTALDGFLYILLAILLLYGLGSLNVSLADAAGYPRVVFEGEVALFGAMSLIVLMWFRQKKAMRFLFLLIFAVSALFFADAAFRRTPRFEKARLQEAMKPFYHNLELKDGYEYGPAEKNAAIAFRLANQFIQREADLKRFRITQPSVSPQGNGERIYDVHYKLLTQGGEREAVVRVDVMTRDCHRKK